MTETRLHYHVNIDWQKSFEIVGLSGNMGEDNKPYTTLSYANGPGYNTTFANGERIDLTNVNTSMQIYYCL